MFETREGILKHCSANNAQILGDVAWRHREGKSPTLEAQATDLGDATAGQLHQPAGGGWGVAVTGGAPPARSW